jgi:hypothetical protein
VAERKRPVRNVDEIIGVIAWLSISMLIYALSAFLIISVQTPS